MPKFELHFHDKVGAQIAYVEHFHAQFDKDVNMQVMDVNNEISKALKEIDADEKDDGKSIRTNEHRVALSDSRQAILNQLLDLADNGDWVKGIEAEDIKGMVRNVLGVGDVPLADSEAKLSATLWNLLEKGRGNNRVRITWQNLVGYFADKMLFNKNGSPSLNKDFFGTNQDYSNIDKGRPSNDKSGDNMPPRFREILPLLDKYVPTPK